MAEQAKTKACIDPECPHDNPQPAENFYYGQSRCKPCFNKRTSEIAKQKREAAKAAAAVAVVIEEPTPEPTTCPPHERICGDDLVEREIPGFFNSLYRERSPRGYEWQVCRKCGDAKQVRLYDATNEADKDIPPAKRESFTPALTVRMENALANTRESRYSGQLTEDRFTRKKTPAAPVESNGNSTPAAEASPPVLTIAPVYSAPPPPEFVRMEVQLATQSDLALLELQARLLARDERIRDLEAEVAQSRAVVALYRKERELREAERRVETLRAEVSMLRSEVGEAEEVAA
jgi:hypothetical protein